MNFTSQYTNRTNRAIYRKLYNNMLFYATFTAMSLYIVWRLAFTIPTRYGPVCFVFGLLLAAAETVAFLEAIVEYYQIKTAVPPELPKIPESWYPDVDIFIATHNEPAELLYKTANACMYLDYPDKNKVHIFICDDGNRTEMAEMAKKLGVGYFGLSGNKHAKAGNLNNALLKTSSPLVVTVDADMILRRFFLVRTVPYFFLPRMKKTEDGRWAEREEHEIDPGEKIGFIQTPQSFYNLDLFQYNLYSETKIPNEQDYFFREINVGRNVFNAPIFAGTNAMLSRRALEEAGYIATDTITEDFETGLKIQSMGYKTYAVDEALAQGLAAADIKNFLSQRERWGRGCIQSLRNTRILTNKKLPVSTKISYIVTFLYWWTFFRRFIYILSPIFFAVFNLILLDCELWQLLAFWLPSYFLYNRALNELSGAIRNQHWSNVVDTILFPYMIGPILKETFGIRQKKFVVTQKTRGTETRLPMWVFAAPHMLLLAASLYALQLCVWRTLESGTPAYMAIIAFWLVINVKNLVFAVLFMFGRQKFRNVERFYVSLPVKISRGGKTFDGITSDISESGFCVVLKRPEYLPPGENLAIHIKYDVYASDMRGEVVHVVKRGSEWKYSVRIREIDEHNKREYYQIVYDRRHTLPKKIEASWGILDDFSLNFDRRLTPIQKSMRQLPRIDIALPFKSEEGFDGTLVNFNYRYAVAALPPSGVDARKLSAGILPGLVMKLERVETETSPDKGILFKVINWNDFIDNTAFDSWLDKSLADAEALRQINAAA